MNDFNKRTILVTGATGHQGGAVARHLLQDGWKVRALTRNVDQPKAQELAYLGAQVVEGNLDVMDSNHPAFQGLYGIFSVQGWREEGIEAEIRRGKHLADIANDLEIAHFVYSSVGGANRHTGVPHFESKWQIERHIQDLCLPATILRPVFFMENFSLPATQQQIIEGRLKMAIKPDRRLQLIAVDDIGGIAAKVFWNPDDYIGREHEIAGDELTMPQVAVLLGHAIGRPVEFEEISIDDLWAEDANIAEMFQWFNEHGYQADIDSLRAIYPQLTDFTTWLKKTGWENLAANVMDMAK